MFIDVHNFIEATKQIQQEFWQAHPENPSAIRRSSRYDLSTGVQAKDGFSICYTFSLLLLLSSPAGVKKRQEDIRVLTRGILKILRQCISNSFPLTRVTDLQCDCSVHALESIRDQYCSMAVDPELISLLKELTMKL